MEHHSHRRPSNRHDPIFKRLAQGIEDIACKLGELIHESEVVVRPQHCPSAPDSARSHSVPQRSAGGVECSAAGTRHQ
jgi:hypothetical protein